MERRTPGGERTRTHDVGTTSDGRISVRLAWRGPGAPVVAVSFTGKYGDVDTHSLTLPMAAELVELINLASRVDHDER